MSDVYECEVWKAIEGFEDCYEVSTRGNVRTLVRRVPSKNGSTRLVKARIRKLRLCNSGYLDVGLRADGRYKCALVHKLVAAAFLDAQPSPLHEVNHKSTIKTDNRTQNLEWVTHQENMDHSVAAGTSLRGSALSFAKLTEADVVQIRQQIARGEMLTQIAKDYGVGRSTIGSIAYGITWKHV